ncbi:MAG: beta-N-acetylglucosaminidase domain-containing protein [Asticcacaulis sp.]|uniref:beta-N-acetylhexosaminidase family protein n=1 Tax=Asticcacaulis sp. TaxID=1872648 RepID=UPI0039E6D69F
MRLPLQNFRFRTLICAGTVLGTAILALSAAATSAEPLATAPAIFPAPASLKLTGTGITLGKTVVLVRAGYVDAETEALVRRVLTDAGVGSVRTATRLPTQLDAVYLVIGTADASAIQAAVKRTGAALPTETEGYTLASHKTDDGALIVLAGKDGDGLYHAAQTLKQIAADDRIPAVTIADHPAMPVRGTIEGFYGKPWSMAERAAHIEFLAGMKANTYIYSPKDDVFARDKWREPYPAETLKDLGGLVAAANRQHINFVYAISPGPSICYSDPADLEAIRSKFAALRGIGVRSFYVALDDIEYTKWNCTADETAFGAPNETAAARAQATLLNVVQADLATAGHGALIMVPTEYFNATVSPYKTELAKDLDPRVVIQWTGTDTVPASISVADARNATKAFGRKTLLWDNYPVNDYNESAGRLLLAPYARREAGLSTELAGIVSNPMNQEVASRPAVMGLIAFAWNDKAYDAERTWKAAARYLAGGDPQTTEALLTFFDTQHLAPTFGNQPWQTQAPQLLALTNRVRDALASGDAAERTAALDALSQAADDLAAAPDRIRAGVAVPGFVTEAQPWLDATALWGRALQLTVSGLRAQDGGTAARFFAEAARLADEASKIRTIPGATRPEGAIRIADGVLDRFIAEAPGLVYLPAPAK